MSAASIALNRFGLGARPDEAPPERPRQWLLDQFTRYEPRPAAWGALPASPQIARDYVEDRREMRQADGEAKQMARKQLRQDNRELYRAAVNARMASALAAPAPFAERLVHFWANHFAVSADKMISLPFIGAFEAEAIRPNIMGSFENLLLAAERHPAMLLYLDQVRSTGPESRLAERVAMRRPERKPGLNENLAREIMELHTLGVRGGYTQADVTEFARAMTGWSVGGLGRQAAADRAEPGRFAFRPAIHEPGTRTIMGKAYAQAGEAQARAVLHDFATAPTTADHIATKLARHFVADDPPPAFVKRLSTAFRQSDGDLPTVYRALVEAPESWAETSSKFKTPWDWLVSALRGIGMTTPGEMQVAPLMQQLGQPVWRPGSPAGFDDIAQSWAAPDALVRRVEVAQRIALRVGDRIDPRSAAAKLLPGAASAETVEAIGRAESQPTGLALLLVSPEFQRR